VPRSKKPVTIPPMSASRLASVDTDAVSVFVTLFLTLAVVVTVARTAKLMLRRIARVSSLW
jgi:hypothetical protein